MVTFEVKDMTCGHCVRTITQAVRAIDHGASVGVDLASHRVRIEPTELDASAFGAAITSAGYTPVLVQDTEAAAPARQKQGGCCGCCR